MSSVPLVLLVWCVCVVTAGKCPGPTCDIFSSPEVQEMLAHVPSPPVTSPCLPPACITAESKGDGLGRVEALADVITTQTIPCVGVTCGGVAVSMPPPAKITPPNIVLIKPPKTFVPIHPLYKKLKFNKEEEEIDENPDGTPRNGDFHSSVMLQSLKSRLDHLINRLQGHLHKSLRTQMIDASKNNDAQFGHTATVHDLSKVIDMKREVLRRMQQMNVKHASRAEKLLEKKFKTRHAAKHAFQRKLKSKLRQMKATYKVLSDMAKVKANRMLSKNDQKKLRKMETPQSQPIVLGHRGTSKKMDLKKIKLMVQANPRKTHKVVNKEKLLHKRGHIHRNDLLKLNHHPMEHKLRSLQSKLQKFLGMSDLKRLSPTARLTVRRIRKKLMLLRRLVQNEKEMLRNKHKKKSARKQMQKERATVTRLLLGSDTDETQTPPFKMMTDAVKTRIRDNETKLMRMRQRGISNTNLKKRLTDTVVVASKSKKKQKVTAASANLSYTLAKAKLALANLHRVAAMPSSDHENKLKAVDAARKALQDLHSAVNGNKQPSAIAPAVIAAREYQHIKDAQTHLEELAKQFVTQQKANEQTIKSLKAQSQAQVANAKAGVSQQKSLLMAAKEGQTAELEALKRLEQRLDQMERESNTKLKEAKTNGLKAPQTTSPATGKPADAVVKALKKADNKAKLLKKGRLHEGAPLDAISVAVDKVKTFFKKVLVSPTSKKTSKSQKPQKQQKKQPQKQPQKKKLQKK